MLASESYSRSSVKDNYGKASAMEDAHSRDQRVELSEFAAAATGRRGNVPNERG